MNFAVFCLCFPSHNKMIGISDTCYHAPQNQELTSLLPSDLVGSVLHPYLWIRPSPTAQDGSSYAMPLFLSFLTPNTLPSDPPHYDWGLWAQLPPPTPTDGEAGPSWGCRPSFSQKTTVSNHCQVIRSECQVTGLGFLTCSPRRSGNYGLWEIHSFSQGRKCHCTGTSCLPSTNPLGPNTASVNWKRLLAVPSQGTGSQEQHRGKLRPVHSPPFMTQRDQKSSCY